MGLVLCAGFVAGIAARAQVQHFGVDMVLSASFCELKDDLFDAAKAVRVVSLEKMQNAQAVSPVVRGSSPAGRQRSPDRQCHPQDGGLYHCTASGETHWHGYASYVIAQARRLAPARPWQVQEIAPVATSAFPTPAKRPANSRLDTRKLQQAFGLVLPPWQQGVDRMLDEILPN